MTCNSVRKECLACASDETFEMVINNCALHVMGVIDKKMKVTPTACRLCSHADEDASEKSFDAANLEVDQFHGTSLELWRLINGYSLDVLNSVLTVWPDARQGNCYFRMLKQ